MCVCVRWLGRVVSYLGVMVYDVQWQPAGFPSDGFSSCVADISWTRGRERKREREGERERERESMVAHHSALQLPSLL